jgi:hypothetical protein
MTIKVVFIPGFVRANNYATTPPETSRVLTARLPFFQISIHFADGHFPPGQLSKTPAEWIRRYSPR